MPGATFDQVAVHGLDRIDDDDRGLVRLGLVDDALDARFREAFETGERQTEPRRARGDLRERFFARDVERLHRRRDRGDGLQQQGRLADAGIAADQHHGAGHQAAAQHAVEFLQPGGGTRGFARLDLGQAAHGAAGGQRRVAVRGGRRGHGRFDGFFQSVPGIAVRTLALPSFGVVPPHSAHTYTGSGRWPVGR